MQRTVVLVKPDGLQRGLIGEIVARFERKGLKLVGLKMMRLNDELLDTWYAHHKEKSFFKDLKSFMTWTPIIAMVWEGQEAISAVRKLVGVTKGYEAEAGSIRGDFAMSGSQNLIHASDEATNAEKEIGLIFTPEEIFQYETAEACLIYSDFERGK
ncbi:nucleoside-diphosphate kinase [Candidatus Collierbacteria bacterium CG17_big_fil_post_rev_8_21_14_2_50_45_7]|uniref:Nucleoside diphosphate kinase n=2 Tax=Candidatus Collieribacteriota TaxID=1752725 RepID=A0A2H0WYA7_9BACT|nr:MAG: nucleoside-diphosphate kinase [Candidatus Collierbacteria bacterium CG09_land_8_20_14_0_10_46_12]PIW08459.1 MAG: nucleoside-diphosphate kinase [Candidatus Collierbacteria bacterium CG17_big_fil_post_rev_8_21_14_2_50_45_7]